MVSLLYVLYIAALSIAALSTWLSANLLNRIAGWRCLTPRPARPPGMGLRRHRGLALVRGLCPPMFAMCAAECRDSSFALPLPRSFSHPPVPPLFRISFSSCRSLPSLPNSPPHSLPHSLPPTSPRFFLAHSTTQAYNGRWTSVASARLCACMRNQRLPASALGCSSCHCLYLHHNCSISP